MPNHCLPAGTTTIRWRPRRPGAWWMISSPGSWLVDSSSRKRKADDSSQGSEKRKTAGGCNDRGDGVSNHYVSSSSSCVHLGSALCAMAIALAGAPALHAAQRPLNLGFERLSVDGDARPWGWSATRVPSSLELRLDSTGIGREGAAFGSVAIPLTATPHPTMSSGCTSHPVSPGATGSPCAAGFEVKVRMALGEFGSRFGTRVRWSRSTAPRPGSPGMVSGPGSSWPSRQNALSRGRWPLDSAVHSSSNFPS